MTTVTNTLLHLGRKQTTATYAMIKYKFSVAGLILGLRPAYERRRYFVTTSLIGGAQT